MPAGRSRSSREGASLLIHEFTRVWSTMSRLRFCPLNGERCNRTGGLRIMQRNEQPGVRLYHSRRHSALSKSLWISPIMSLGPGIVFRNFRMPLPKFLNFLPVKKGNKIYFSSFKKLVVFVNAHKTNCELLYSKNASKSLIINQGIDFSIRTFKALLLRVKS